MFSIGEMAVAAFLAVFVVGVAAGSAVTTVDHAGHSPSLPSPCRFAVQWLKWIPL